jgi:tRNA pseudouridine synthase 10
MEREGFKANSRVKPESCWLCAGNLDQVPSLSTAIVEKLGDYEFKTFLVGASVPQEMLDREDELRSRLKIKGRESLKAQITTGITKRILESTTKRLDYSRPDLTILVSLLDRSFSINPRSLWLSARYTKTRRGIAQRSSQCDICNGLGCAKCNYLGRSAESVQAFATKFFVDLFQAESCNFVWLGSEDENSLVLGEGRPFFVEVVKPKKRVIRPKLAKRIANCKKDIDQIQREGIEIHDLRVIPRKVTEVPQFEVSAIVHMRLENGRSPIDPENIDSLEKSFTNAAVAVRLSRKFRIVKKQIKSTKVSTSEDKSSLDLSLECDGGIPLKKLVTGQDKGVEPNMFEALKSYRIDENEPFDIFEVRIKSKEEKNFS